MDKSIIGLIVIILLIVLWIVMISDLQNTGVLVLNSPLSILFIILVLFLILAIGFCLMRTLSYRYTREQKELEKMFILLIITLLIWSAVLFGLANGNNALVVIGLIFGILATYGSITIAGRLGDSTSSNLMYLATLFIIMLLFANLFIVIE